MRSTRRSLLALACVLWAVSADAQTRFYFPQTTAAAVSPAIDTDWTNNTGTPTRRKLVTVKLGEALTDQSVATTSANPEYTFYRQYVSDPLSAQTISGTVKGQIRCSEATTGANVHVAVGIYVVSNDGSTRTGALLDPPSASDNSPNTFECATTLVNRQVMDASESASITLSNVSANAGDRLVVEVGIRDTSTSTTSQVLRFGDSAATDLAEDNTDADDDNPWIEFSGTISFQGSGPAPGARLLFLARPGL